MALSGRALSLLQHKVETQNKPLAVHVASVVDRLKEDITVAEAQKALGIKPAKKVQKSKKK